MSIFAERVAYMRRIIVNIAAMAVAICCSVLLCSTSVGSGPHKRASRVPFFDRKDSLLMPAVKENPRTNEGAFAMRIEKLVTCISSLRRAFQGRRNSVPD